MSKSSYSEKDVKVLMKNINIKNVDIKEKEKLIQSGKKHYSEMISSEYLPTKEYLNVFYDSIELNKEKLSTDVILLSKMILNFNKKPIIVSLARAGTPIGVLLKRTIENFFNIDTSHYSISIIRDKEIDNNALKYILETESKKNGETFMETSTRIVFVDGWTGKGVINRELKKYVSEFNTINQTNISTDLYVLSDISGKADFSPSHEDYLIPSAALNSTVSGLISRSILNDLIDKEKDFHGCIYYEEFEKDDLSLWYIEEIMKEVEKIIKTKEIKVTPIKEKFKEKLSIISDNFIKEMKEKYNISNINYIKPGVGETTRVLLRRFPDFIILKNIESENTAHIVKLAKDKNVKVIEDKNLIYSSVGIIKEI